MNAPMSYVMWVGIWLPGRRHDPSSQNATKFQRKYESVAVPEKGGGEGIDIESENKGEGKPPKHVRG